MKPELKKALYLLENIGYTVKPMNESAQQDLVDTIKSKYDEWEELRNTPEGDDLWDEMVDAYGNDLIDLAVDEYDAIKNGKPVDMTGYLAHADALYPEFFELMQSPTEVFMTPLIYTNKFIRDNIVPYIRGEASWDDCYKKFLNALELYKDE